jgi:hypothetical protein
MRRWILPNAVGIILFVLLVGVETLCGDTVVTLAPYLVRQSIDDPPPRVTTSTLGYPPLLVITDDPTKPNHVHWLRLIVMLVAGWLAATAVGRLALDGGCSPAQATLLPPRRHPALWMLAYFAAVPALALAGALHDLHTGGIAGLFSPTGPHRFPLLMLILTIIGLPCVAMFLAVRRVLDRRHIERRRFETDATPKTEIEWPF